MEAIINVKGASAYSVFNGHTFEVSKIWNHSVDVKGINPEYPQNDVNFTFAEIIIPNLGEELQKAYDAANWYGGEHLEKYNALVKYCELKKFKNTATFTPAQ